MDCLSRSLGREVRAWVKVLGERPSFLNDITVSNDEDEGLGLYATEHYSSRIEKVGERAPLTAIRILPRLSS